MITAASNMVFAWGGIKKVKLTYNYGYDTILRQNIGFGLFAVRDVPTCGEEYGYLVESRIGMDGFCLSVEYAITGCSDHHGRILAPYGLGWSIGLSYIYNSENGTVYNHPVRGVGISGRIGALFTSLTFGVYEEIANEDRDRFYRIGLSLGF